jgi:hypothetical protein
VRVLEDASADGVTKANAAKALGELAIDDKAAVVAAGALTPPSGRAAA